MALQKTSTLMTAGGITAAFGASLVGIPLIVIQAYAQVVKEGVPHWFSVLILPMMLLGFVLSAAGTAIMGVAGKGQDDTPTVPQVNAATAKAVADNLTAQSSDPAKDPALMGTPPPGK